MDIRDQSGAQNLVANHLNRIERSEDADPLPMRDDFLDESLLTISVSYPTPWFASIVNFLELRLKKIIMILSIIFGMTPICGSCAVIR